MNPDRQTTPDIDSDYYADDREKAKELVLNDKRLNTCEIAAFGTIAIRGAVREVGRALEIRYLNEIKKTVLNIEMKNQ